MNHAPNPILKDQAKMRFYDSIADSFDLIVNEYDTCRRVKIVFDELLPENIDGKNLLDVGCGTGWFSRAAKERGAIVTSLDIGSRLLEKVRMKCETNCIQGSVLKLPFVTQSFDFVVSSEVIEHVTDPSLALQELFRVLKPGGVAAITTPNKFWHWSLLVANLLRIRPYQGLENWLGYEELLSAIERYGLKILYHRGLHLFPFIIKRSHTVLTYLDSYHRYFDRYMVNICVAAMKPRK